MRHGDRLLRARSQRGNRRLDEGIEQTPIGFGPPVTLTVRQRSASQTGTVRADQPTQRYLQHNDRHAQPDPLSVERYFAAPATFATLAPLIQVPEQGAHAHAAQKITEQHRRQG